MSKVKIVAWFIPMLDSFWEAKSEIIKLQNTDLLEKVEENTFFPEYLQYLDKDIRDELPWELIEILKMCKTRKEFLRQMCSLLANDLIEVK